MKSGLAVALAGAMICAASGVWASQTVWLCTVSSQLQGSYVMDSIAFTHDEAADTALVNDALIMSLKGQPIAATVSASDSGKVRFEWTVTSIPSSRGKASVSYRATLIKATGKLSVTAQPLGYDNTFFDKGRCKQQG